MFGVDIPIVATINFLRFNLDEEMIMGKTVLQ